MTKKDVNGLLDWQFTVSLLLGPLIWLLLAIFMPLRENWTGIFDNSFKLLLLVGIYPILEEVVFRGFILEWLSDWTKKRRYRLMTLANLLTSGLFVLAHFVYQPWMWALLVFFPSLVFGYMKERYNSILPPIIVHSFYNLGFILLYG